MSPGAVRYTAGMNMLWCLGRVGGTVLAGVMVMSSPAGCAPRASSLARVEATIDRYHAAASAAELEAYIGLMTPDGVFLGTDASERWTREEFVAFCEPNFADGHGWTYVPRDRHVAFAPGGRVAWFDEILSNEAYGTLRGSGVLTRRGGAWRIEQYNLAFLVPNGVAKEVVELIGGADAR